MAERKQAYTYLKYYLESVLQLLLKFGCGGRDEKENKTISKTGNAMATGITDYNGKKKRETNCGAKWWLYIVAF